MGAHTDYGVLTILLADDVPGLQVFGDGRWNDVDVPRGNVRLQPRRHARTLDEQPLDLHPAPGGAAARDEAGPVRRRSIARFLDCPPDLVVECIPTCVGARRHRASYEPVVAGAWLRQKILGGRARRQPDLGEAVV